MEERLSIRRKRERIMGMLAQVIRTNIWAWLAAFLQLGEEDGEGLITSALIQVERNSELSVSVYGLESPGV